MEIKNNISILKISGKNALKDFSKEVGVHRWQRIPPTEKRGRVHTSTVTIAVLQIPKYQEFSLDTSELRVTATRGSGAGGQHRNKRDTAIVVFHRPTGIQIRSESCKSQHQNKQIALEMLAAKLQKMKQDKKDFIFKENRKKQVGAGMRAEKVRTIRLQDGIVKNHLNGRQISAKKYLKGYIDEIL